MSFDVRVSSGLHVFTEVSTGMGACSVSHSPGLADYRSTNPFNDGVASISLKAT